MLGLSQCARISGIQLIEYCDIESIVKLGVSIAKSAGKSEELCQLYVYGAIEALRKPDSCVFEKFMNSLAETISAAQIKNQQILSAF